MRRSVLRVREGSTQGEERERERETSRVSERAGENGEERTADARDALEGEEHSAPPLRRGERITGRDWVNGEVRV